ncbi:related to UPC2-regulatory protein involved in control of sterol uptake [Rhynchosporium agropyri]|uniref:Related to UPC2-regulatory protein involved in control of sterol uptake n=1 Tax=Rhynchosporium agropyri TaxID=914238 RepID=A0A1E1JUM8_9HELO|nr:related to UPC2-regulatory protein involved in control of sterol uptake [Rhynchosporium agropyri]
MGIASQTRVIYHFQFLDSARPELQASGFRLQASGFSTRDAPSTVTQEVKGRLPKVSQFFVQFFDTCKNRKIKCDEVHPACGNCLKHGVSCDFESPETPASASTPSIAAPSPVMSSASPVSTPRSSSNSSIMPLYQTPTAMVRAHSNPAVSRSLEFRLLHHYTALTSQTFSDTKEQNHVWQVDIPTIAYDAQYLMDAILAVSALHLRSMHPEDHSLIRASHGYMASSIAQYSNLLNKGLSEMNAEALFSTAALIAFQASASRRFDDDANGTYTLPLAWFHSFQGVKTVVLASWQWLRSSNRVYPIINSQPALFLDPDPERKLFFAPLLEGLEEQLATLPAESQPATRQAYEHAVSFLNWSHQKPIRNRILGFAATVSRRFVDLVGQQDPRALVIAACFFALTKMVDNVWWLEGIAKREVNGILSILPQEWWPKMEWALRVASHEGPLNEEIWGSTIRSPHENDSIKLEEEFEAGVTHHIELLASMVNGYVDKPMLEDPLIEEPLD